MILFFLSLPFLVNSNFVLSEIKRVAIDDVNFLIRDESLIASFSHTTSISFFEFLAALFLIIGMFLFFLRKGIIKRA